MRVTTINKKKKKKKKKKTSPAQMTRAKMSKGHTGYY